jgi:chemotaxis protein histidine kinase CheA
MKRSAAPHGLPAWIFIATDLALIGAAAVIAFRTEEPLSAGNVVAIVGCVALGSVVGLIPLIARYERQKNALLDERQRAIEGMAQTLAAAAEQISIATASLHGINETAQKNLQQAAQLPQRLQEKVAAIQLGDVEKLETLAGRLSKAAAELAKHEAAAAQQSASARDHLAKLAEGGEAIARAQAAAVAALESKLAELDTRLAATVTHTTPVAPAAPEEAAPTVPAQSAPSATIPAESTPALSTAPATDFPAPTQAGEPATAAADTAPAAPKRPRKPRAKPTAPEPAPEGTVSAEPTESAAPAAPPEPATAPPAETAVEPPPATEAPAAVVPAVPENQTPPTSASFEAVIPEVSPAPAVVDAPPQIAEPKADQEVAPAPESTAAPAPEPASEPMARKRAPRKPQPEPEPSLDLPLEDTSGAQGPGAIERTISSDGATRLIATAYIGIGNRLFIRGEGAGLSWDKGVPLQFVSIGKWRWETNEASAPVRFKLYKNDEQECASLGEQVLEPGHLQEMSAKF